MCNFVSRGGWLTAGGPPTLTWEGAIISSVTSAALIRMLRHLKGYKHG